MPIFDAGMSKYIIHTPCKHIVYGVDNQYQGFQDTTVQCTPFIIAERFVMVHFQFIMTILNFVVHYFVIDSIFETL